MGIEQIVYDRIKLMLETEFSALPNLLVLNIENQLSATPVLNLIIVQLANDVQTMTPIIGNVEVGSIYTFIIDIYTRDANDTNSSRANSKTRSLNIYQSINAEMVKMGFERKTKQYFFDNTQKYNRIAVTYSRIIGNDEII